MSNEIGKNLNNFNSITKTSVNDKCSKLAQSTNGSKLENNTKMQETMEFLGTMGLSQVIKAKPSKTTIKAVDELKNDYEYVQNHISFCNNLVAKGYSLQEADRITQKVFSSLKNKNTYN